jgi:hypothetical protein
VDEELWAKRCVVYPENEKGRMETKARLSRVLVLYAIFINDRKLGISYPVHHRLLGQTAEFKF